MGNNPTPKPIDVANAEIRNLKKQLAILRSEITLIKSQLKPVREDYLKSIADEAAKDNECVVESRGWWFS